MKSFVTALILLVLAGTSSAQITITSDDLLGSLHSGTTTSETFNSEDTTGLGQLIDLAGPGVTWDFTGRTYTVVADTSTQSVIPYPGDAALADDPAFLGSTHVLVAPPALRGDPTQYEFLTLNSNGMWMNGVTQDSAGTKSKVMIFDPPFQFYKLPLTYQSSWRGGSAIESSYFPAGVNIRDSIDAVVDGYGQIVTPSGSFNVLRLKEKFISVVSYPPFGSSSSANYQFDWMSKNGAHAIISADSLMHPGEGQSTPGVRSSSVASYSVAAQGGVDASDLEHQPIITLSQNPASNTSTEMYFTLDHDATVNLTLTDVGGNVVRSLKSGLASAGKNAIEIDPKSLTPGTYFIHLAAPAVNATEKLLIVR